MFYLKKRLVLFDMSSWGLRIFAIMVLKYDMLLNVDLEYSTKTTMV